MKRLRFLAFAAVLLVWPATASALSKQIIATMAACANEAFPVTGTIHYACDCQAGAAPGCVNGNDASAGTSPATAWRTYAKLMTVVNSMAAGDTIAFCTGGSFSKTVEVQTANFNCTAGNRCLIRDYVASWAVGGESKPIISIVGNLIGINFQDGGSADPDAGYRVLNLDFEGNGSNQYGAFFYNDVKDVLLCNDTFNDFNVGVLMSGSNAPASGDGKNARIVVQGCTITNSNSQGALWACDDCHVNYNYLNQNGGDTVFDHGVYIEGQTDGTATPYTTEREQLIGNEIDNSEHVSTQSLGVYVVMHGQHDLTVITDNLIQEVAANATNGSYGISVVDGYSSLEFFTNVTIARNAIINPGLVGINETLCTTCTISDNLIVAGANTSSGTIGILWGSSVPSQDSPGSNATIVNNTLYVNNSNHGGTGVSIAVQGTGHVSANNVVNYVGTGTFNCYNYPLSGASYTFIDNNYCYHPSSGGAWEQSTGDSLAAWQGATSFDAHSFIVNPKFALPGTLAPYDFHPFFISPLVNTGNHTHASTTDLTGVTRPNPPDVGAYQHNPIGLFSVHAPVKAVAPPWYSRLWNWFMGFLRSVEYSVSR